MTHPFITHNGGPCPVSPEAIGDVEFADGTILFDVPFWWLQHADRWEWKGDPDYAVVRYRLHQPDKGEAS